MRNQAARRALGEITNAYLESSDFNGLRFVQCAARLGISEATMARVVRVLVERGLATAVFGDRHPNPHIRAFADEPAADVLARLDGSLVLDACLYPTSKHLEEVVSPDDYAGRPYELQLALGGAQLDFRAFDLSVLEYYRNDPRYSYSNDDINGWISVHDEYYESGEMPEGDKVFLQTFGFCYDKDLNRGVAVFLRYLSDLSPEHQQMWRAKELHGSYALHPDYYRSAILGKWGTRLPIFQAFTEELALINKMSELMGRPPLFREAFETDRPREFSFLVRPTLGEFNRFVSTLDKMLSENINKGFFLGDVPDVAEESLGDGRVMVRPRGTISMLEDWLKQKFATDDTGPLEEAIEVLKSVRALRQKPAHAVEPDRFDQQYLHRQRDLIVRSYAAVRTLRLVWANHPAVRRAEVDVPELLHKGEIWEY